MRTGLRFLLLGSLAAVVVWGGWSLVRLLSELSLIDSSGQGDWKSVFLLRDLWHFHFFGTTPLALVTAKPRSSREESA